MKQHTNEIHRMQQLAGIINEVLSDETIAKALKDASISTVDEYGDRWAITINGKKKIYREDEASVKAVIEKLKRLNILPGAMFDVVDTLAKYK
jgi:uncharacterized protein YlzI (FlbEa/FlbD family)